MPDTTTTISSDRIEKQLTIDAPRTRVWQALTDVTQFNAWFGVALTSPFTPGAEVTGKATFKGYEHLDITLWIETLKPENFFSFRWHPFAMEDGIGYNPEPTTLVTFTLEEVTAARS